MTMILDPELVESVEGTPNGTEIPLTDEQKQTPVFFTYVSTDTTLSDIQPVAPWKRQICADIPVGVRNRPRLAIGENAQSARSVNESDGLIVDLEGHEMGIYGWIDGRWQDQDVTDEWESQTNSEAPKSVRWGFRITRILKTNGPELRDKAFRTDEQKKESEKAELFETLVHMFKGAQGVAQATNSDLKQAVEKVTSKR